MFCFFKNKQSAVCRQQGDKIEKFYKCYDVYLHITKDFCDLYYSQEFKGIAIVIRNKGLSMLADMLTANAKEEILIENEFLQQIDHQIHFLQSFND